MKRLTMSKHDVSSPVTHADNVLCRYGVASRTGQIVVRQSVKPFLTTAKHLQVLRTQSKWKSKVIGVVPTLPSREGQLFGIDLVMNIEPFQIVVNRECR